ncbi:IS481 family transposase, partial [Pseudoalteromonas sp. S1691]
RREDWLQKIDGAVLHMCSWERFASFAREPEKRKVGIDARLPVEGRVFAVEPDLAGEEVVRWWGVFDDELYGDHDGERYGAY